MIASLPAFIRRLGLALLLAPAALLAADFEAGAVQRSDGAGFYLNAIPQVARLGNGQLLTVWCGHAKGAERDRVYGALSADGGRTWSAPRVLIEDAVKADGDPNILVDGNRTQVFSTRVAVPNPIDKSWTMMISSDDFGRTWSSPKELVIPRQYVSGKQHNGIKLRDGTLMMGISWDKWPEFGMHARTEGEMDITVGVLVSKDGLNWTLHGALHAFVEKETPNCTNGLDEPSLVELDNGQVFMLLRAGATHHYESRSDDDGITWSPPVPSPLPGNNTPSALWRLDDHPEEIAVLWNSSPLARYPLCAALSADGGKTWSAPRLVAGTEKRQVSYPSLTQASDHTFVAVWQQDLAGGGRDIRWARFTRDWILGSVTPRP